MKNEEEAKDAVQEVFKKYVESEENFKGECKTKTWLLVIARNYYYNRLKRKDSRNHSFDQEVLNKKYERNLDEEISLNNALQKLSADENELIFFAGVRILLIQGAGGNNRAIGR